MIAQISIAENPRSISTYNGMPVNTIAEDLAGLTSRSLKPRTPSADTTPFPAAPLHLRQFPTIFPIIPYRLFSWGDWLWIDGFKDRE